MSNYGGLKKNFDKSELFCLVMHMMQGASTAIFLLYILKNFLNKFRHPY
jgi:hypothetical protein